MEHRERITMADDEMFALLRRADEQYAKYLEVALAGIPVPPTTVQDEMVKSRDDHQKSLSFVINI